MEEANLGARFANRADRTKINDLITGRRGNHRGLSSSYTLAT